jgi:hypothetical protein
MFAFAIPPPAPNPGVDEPPNVDDCFPFITPGVPLLGPNPTENPGEDEIKPATPLLASPTPGGESKVFVPPLITPGLGPNPGVCVVVGAPEFFPKGKELSLKEAPPFCDDDKLWF